MGANVKIHGPDNIGSNTAYTEMVVETDGSIDTRIFDGNGLSIGSSVDADGENHLNTGIIQKILTSTGNTTTDNLTAGSTFTGEAEATFGINGIQVYHKADQDCTVYLDQGLDGTNWDVVDDWIVTADHPFTTTVTSVAPYFRLRVTNTSASETTSLASAAGMTPVINPLPRALSSTDRLKVQNEDLFIEIPRGTVRYFDAINKFGENTNIDSGNTEEIWDGNRAYIWPTTASITHVRAAVDSATTQSVVLEVQGLDANWDEVIQTVTTNAADSTTEVALDTALLRVYRVKVLDANVMDQDIWVGPTGMSAATANAIVQAGNNQTLMAQYTVPAGCTAYMTNWKATVNPATNLDPTSMPIRMWARDNANGYASQLKDSQGLITGTLNIQYKPYYEFSEKTDIYFTASPVGKAADVSLGFDLILIQNQ